MLLLATLQKMKRIQDKNENKNQIEIILINSKSLQNLANLAVVESVINKKTGKNPSTDSNSNKSSDFFIQKISKN